MNGRVRRVRAFLVGRAILREPFCPRNRPANSVGAGRLRRIGKIRARPASLRQTNGVCRNPAGWKATASRSLFRIGIRSRAGVLPQTPHRNRLHRRGAATGKRIRTLPIKNQLRKA